MVNVLHWALAEVLILFHLIQKLPGLLLPAWSLCPPRFSAQTFTSIKNNNDNNVVTQTDPQVHKTPRYNYKHTDTQTFFVCEYNTLNRWVETKMGFVLWQCTHLHIECYTRLFKFFGSYPIAWLFSSLSFCVTLWDYVKFINYFKKSCYLSNVLSFHLRTQNSSPCL